MNDCSLSMDAMEVLGRAFSLLVQEMSTRACSACDNLVNVNLPSLRL